MPKAFGYGKRIISANKKTNNHAAALPAKVDIRERVLEAIGRDRAVVLDAYAGEGQLYRRVWSRAADYVGIDTKWYPDERLMYAHDCRRVMRAMDLGRFTVFDFDPWGSPWEPVAILCGRRAAAPGETLGICLTEGSSLKVKMGKLPTGLAQMSGWPRGNLVVWTMMGDIVNRALTEMARRLNCRIVTRWQAHGTTASRMMYMGLVLEGLPIQAGPAAEGVR